MRLSPTITAAPSYINWNYTYKCNFRCTHCYSRSAEYPRELDSEQYKQISKSIAKLGVFAVGFGGGEPLFRQDLLETLEILGHQGVETHLTSNGWLIDQALARRLKALEVGMVLVSVDSIDRVQHDTFRDKRDSFDRAVIALDFLVAAGVPTYVSWVVNKTNLDQLESLADFALERGLTGVSLKLFRSAGYGLVNRSKYELSKAETIQVTRRVQDLRSRKLIDFAFFQSETTGSQGCSCGITQLTLRPNGDVALCPYDDAVVGNVTETPLAEIWRNCPEILQRRAADPSCLVERGSTIATHGTNVVVV